MRKDPKAFRERFKAWKNGQLVYLSGRPTDLYLDKMEDVARLNADNWGMSEDEALVHVLNDNTYNYRGYYDKYPESSADSKSHWTDEFKTVYHPTFSNESQYHGKKSLYNPFGLRGGMWVGDKFQPASWQSRAKALRINKLGYKDGKDSSTTLRQLTVTPNGSYASVSPDDMLFNIQQAVDARNAKNVRDYRTIMRNMNAAQDAVAREFGLPLMLSLAGNPLDLGIEGGINLFKTAKGFLKSKSVPLPRLGLGSKLMRNADASTIEKYLDKYGSVMEVPNHIEIGSPKYVQDILKAKEDALNFLLGDVRPRMRRLYPTTNIDPYSHYVHNKLSLLPDDNIYTNALTKSKLKIADIGDNVVNMNGWQNGNDIFLIRQPNRLTQNDLSATLVHEGEHAQRRLLGRKQLLKRLEDPTTTNTFRYAYNLEETDYLNNAYKFTAEFLKEHPKAGLDAAEKGATNREMRYILSKQNGNVYGSDLDAIIDKLSIKQIEELLANTNGYSENFLNFIKNEIESEIKFSGGSRLNARSRVWSKFSPAIKKALKNVAVGTGAVYTGSKIKQQKQTAEKK